MTGLSAILATALAFGFGPSLVEGQTAPLPQQQQPPVAVQTPEPDAIILTGCVVPSPDLEDSLRFVPAEPAPGRPVGTTGTSPAWTVPAYLLLGGIVNFAEHGNKTVEITGVIEPPGAAVQPDPKRTGDTTTRAAQAVAPMARLNVRAAKVVAATCTPKKQDASKQGR